MARVLTFFEGGAIINAYEREVCAVKRNRDERLEENLWKILLTKGKKCSIIP